MRGVSSVECSLGERSLALVAARLLMILAAKKLFAVADCLGARQVKPAVGASDHLYAGLGRWLSGPPGLPGQVSDDEHDGDDGQGDQDEPESHISDFSTMLLTDRFCQFGEFA